MKQSCFFICPQHFFLSLTHVWNIFVKSFVFALKFKVINVSLNSFQNSFSLLATLFEHCSSYDSDSSQEKLSNNIINLTTNFFSFIQKFNGKALNFCCNRGNNRLDYYVTKFFFDICARSNYSTFKMI